MGSSIIVGIFFIVNFSLTSSTNISICGSCTFYSETFDSSGNSWSLLCSSCPASSTIKYFPVALYATATVHLVHCFLCCDIGFRCWQSFLAGSWPPVAAHMVSALVSPYWIPVASLRSQASIVSSLVALFSHLVFLLCSALQCFRCHFCCDYNAIDSPSLTDVLLYSPDAFMDLGLVLLCTNMDKERDWSSPCSPQLPTCLLSFGDWSHADLEFDRKEHTRCKSLYSNSGSGKQRLGEDLVQS